MRQGDKEHHHDGGGNRDDQDTMGQGCPPPCAPWFCVPCLFRLDKGLEPGGESLSRLRGRPRSRVHERGQVQR